MKLIKNSFQCLLCNDVLVSLHRHDFKACSCGKMMIDGGTSYVRIMGNLEKIKDLCEYEDDTQNSKMSIDK